MKISVYIESIDGKVWLPVGPVIDSLAEARIVVKFLDWLLSIGNLPKFLAFYTEETRVQARSEYGRVWEYMDQDPSGFSDGIWDGPSEEGE